MNAKESIKKICNVGEVGMIKDRIVDNLEHCRKNQNSNDCQSCEYGGRSFQICERLVDDIIVLLKEQEAKSPVVRKKNGYWDYVCPTCGSRDEELFREWNYCPYCGQEVKWE